MKTLKAIFFILLSTILFGCNENTPSTGVSEEASQSENTSIKPTIEETESSSDSEIIPPPTIENTSEPVSEPISEPISESISEPEPSINVEEVSSIINQTFDLSNVTILYVNAPSATEKEIFITSGIYYEKVDSIESYIYQKEGINYKVSKIYGTEEYEKVEYTEYIEYNLRYLFKDFDFEISSDISEYEFFDLYDFGACNGYVFINNENTKIGISINEETLLLENIYIFDENGNIIELFKIKLEDKNISIDQIEELVKEEIHEHTPSETYLANQEKHWKFCETCNESYDYQDHTLETIEAKEATCTEEGSTEGLKCSICEYYVIYPQVTPIVDHDFEGVTWEEVVAPTYTEGGEEHQKCKNCEYYNVRYTNKLEIPVPEVIISNDGIASWPIVEGIDTYLVKTGANEPEYFQETLQIQENSFKLDDMQYIQVAYVAEDGRRGMFSEFQLFEYNYNSIDLLKNIESVDENSDGSYTLTVKLDETTNIRLVLENGIYNAAGNIEFNSETKLYSLDSLTTIASYHVDLLYPSTDVTKYIYVKEGINVANKMSVSSKDELDYYSFSMVSTGLTFKTYRCADYFEIYSNEDHIVTNITIQYTKDYQYDCDGFEYYASSFPFLEGTRQSIYTMQGILLKVKRDVPTLEPYDNITIPINKTNVRYFVDENGNELPSDTVINKETKLQVEYQGVIENIDLGFIEKANYSSYFESHPYQNSKAIGNVRSLVIPLVWNDQKDMKKDEILNSIKTALGNIVDENGNITTYYYEDPSKYTLSEYMGFASYWKLQTSAFVTNWYESEYNFEDIRDFTPEEDYIESIVNWAIDTYNLNIKDFDIDNNGVIDSIIILHTGETHRYDSYVQASWAGAVRWTFHDQTKDENYNYNIDINNPRFVNAITSSISFMYNEVENYNVENSTALTLIHEFAHNFGIVDYYSSDTNDVLGGYDMQTSNVGDWNAFSKFAVGWIEPTIINKDDFTNSNTVSYTLEEFVENGDVLLIPSKNIDYNGSPFDEYIMVELFTPKKLHEFDSVSYGLNDTIGIRIYHVNATMRLVENYYYDYGDHAYSSAKSNDYGAQIIELIQKSKVNEFQDDDYSNNRLSSEDFFYVGDSFDVSEYDEFFYKGLMDDGNEFGYVINIKSIYLDETSNSYKADIEITLK